jgi:hypothetical protein
LINVRAVKGAGHQILREMSKIRPRSVSFDVAAQIKAGAEQDAAGAHHHHRREPSPIGDAAGRDDRHAARRQINDRGHDVERRARSAMAAGFRALRDQNIGAGIERLLCHFLGLDLADQETAGRLDARCKRLRVAERQHDRARLGLQRDIEEFALPGQAPGDESDAKWRGGSPELGGFLLQPRLLAVASAENAEAAGLADRRNQPRTGNDRHRRRKHRVLDAKERRQRCADGHDRGSRYGQVW